MAIYHINVLVTGPKGVGKTSFINRSISGHFINTTNNNNVLEYNSNKGKVYINFVDENDSTSSIDYTILMLNNIKNIDEWIKETSPDVICFTKNDVDENKLTDEDIDELFSKNINTLKYEISSKSQYNLEKPVLTILKKHLHTDEIFCVNN